MRYLVKGNCFIFIHAPESLVRKLEKEGFSIIESFQLLSGDYKIVVRLPKLDTKNAIVKEASDEY